MEEFSADRKQKLKNKKKHHQIQLLRQHSQKVIWKLNIADNMVLEKKIIILKIML